MSQDSNFREPDIPVFWPLLFIWLTMFATFTLPGRDAQPTAESLDAIALIKVAARGMAIVVLGWIVFSRLRGARTRAIVASATPWILFIGWAFASAAWSPIKSITIGQAAGQLALLMLCITIAISPKFTSQYLLHAVLALASYSAFYGIGAIAVPGLYAVGRTSESLVHATALGAAASLGLVMTSAILLTAGWRWVKPVCIGTIPLFLIALLVAQNRLSIALTIVLCLGLILFKGQSFRLAAGAVAVSLVGCIYMLIDQGLEVIEAAAGSSINFMQRGQDVHQLAELSGRTEMWTKMWRSYTASPIIGHGYFMCSPTGKLYVWYTDQNHTAHNIVLQALVSTGIIGLLLLSTWMFQLVRICISTVTRQVQAKCIPILVSAIAMWFAGWCMLNSSVLGPIRPESTVYAIAVGLLIGQYVRIGQQQNVDQLLANESDIVR